jgi:hypothetical protein
MPHPATERPAADEFAPEFGKYIELVPDGDIRQFLTAQHDELVALLASLSEADSLVHHAPYTWSSKQVLGHITDCERVFGHRAHWIARGATAALTTFDEQAFMDAIDFDRCPFAELLDEFTCVRRGHLHLFAHLNLINWLRRGIVNEHPMTPRALAWAIAGHTQHHLDILHRRLQPR